MTSIAIADKIKSHVSSNLFGRSFSAPISEARIILLIVPLIAFGAVAAVSFLGSVNGTAIDGFYVLFRFVIPIAILFYLTICRPVRDAYREWVHDILIHPASEHLFTTIGEMSIERLSRSRYEVATSGLTFECMVQSYQKNIACRVQSSQPNGGIATILEVCVRPGENAIFRIVKRAEWLDDGEINALLGQIDRHLQDWSNADIKIRTGIKNEISKLGSAPL